MLEINNLHAEVDGKPILRGLNLRVAKGETAVIMGPNGSGKSTLSRVLTGDASYRITAGEILFQGRDIVGLAPNERAVLGLFLAFQYPVEIPGVANMTFLRAALNSLRKARGQEEVSIPEFAKLVRNTAAELGVSLEMLKRPLNVGFSGGEKKRNEIMQMTILQPSFCILDEADSGLDIDALRIVADGLNRMRSPERSFLVITHYQRLLNYITPDKVHVMSNGTIVRSGGGNLALELERDGYGGYDPETSG